MRVMKRATRMIAAAGLVLALAACDGVGDGSKPEALSIVKNGFLASPTKAFTCTREQLLLAGRFTTGALGEFSSRARWTSSDPSVLRVSNGDIPVPGEDGLFFARGQLIPVAPGTATITATAFGLSESLEIEVDEPGEIFVSAVGYADEAAAKTAVNIARTTRQQLSVTALIDGHPQDITASADWDFVAPDDTVATFVKDSDENNTNVIQASASKDGTLTARAKFLTCDRAPTLQISVKQPNDTLVLRREIKDDTRSKFVVGTSEIFRVYADFNNDGQAEQDLSTQLLVTSSAPAVILPGAFGIASAVRALSTGEGTPAPTESAPVKLTFCIPVPPPDPLPEDYEASCATPKVELNGLTALSDQLKSFTIITSDNQGVPLTAEDANVSLAPLATVQFRAKGTFVSGFQQDVTRNMVWESNLPAEVTINATSGIARSNRLQPPQGEDTDGDGTPDGPAPVIKISATNNAETVTTKEKEVTVTITNP